jgi:hypothetical protein
VVRFGFCLVCLLVFGVAASSQEVLAPPPPEFAPKPATLGTYGFPTAATNQPETVPPQTTTTTPGPSAIERYLDWGPVHLHPHLLYRVSYGNGLQSAPGEKATTVINELSPGMLIDVGNHWHLDYTPTLRFYSSKHFRDETDHSANLTWGTIYQDWALGASQSYVSSSSPLVETASQTDTETYSTSVNATWQMGSKMSLDFAASQDFRFLGQTSVNGQGLSDSRTWSTTEGFNYQFWPRFSAGLGVTFAYDDLKVGTDMTSEQLNGRINWVVGQKLTLSLSGGVEDRQFLDSREPDSLTPIFAASIIYHPFEPTTLTLSANRTVTASYFDSQITEITGFTGSLQQRLLGELTLNVTGGFTSTSYQSTFLGFFTVNRQDDRSTVNVRLSYPFIKRGTASVFYDWSDNSSNVEGFKYQSNQAGLELGYRF